MQLGFLERQNKKRDLKNEIIISVLAEELLSNYKSEACLKVLRTFAMIDINNHL